MRQKSHGRSVLLVNGAPPMPNTQRLNAQAVRDEVESRLSAMLAEATESKRGGGATGEVVHMDANAAGSGQSHSPFLPPIASRTSPLIVQHHDHQGCHAALSRIPGVGGTSSVILEKKPDHAMFSVQGTPQAILRHCIKHFLAHPETYGSHVHALLQDELGYVLSVWASSPIVNPGQQQPQPDASLPKKGSRSSAKEQQPPPNFVEDNFFDCLIREEIAKRQLQEKTRTAQQQSRHRSAQNDSDEHFLAEVNSPLLPLMAVPRPPPLDDRVNEGCSPMRGALAIAAAPSTTKKNGAASVVANDNDRRTMDDIMLATLGNYEVNTLRRQVKSLQQMNVVLTEQLNTKNMEFRDLRLAMTDTEQTIEELEGAIVVGKRSKEALELQLQDLKGSLDDQLLKVTSFRDEEEDKRRTTEARLLEVRSELGQVYLQWKTTQNQLAASQKELDRSVEECEELHSNFQTAKQRLAKANRTLARRNRTISLMQELLLQRREAHGKLQQCVKELEVFSGAGTLTELYLASDPAWSSFLFYRLHRHVFHVSACVSCASVSPIGTLTVDAPMFGATSEGGSWRVSGFSTELLYRLMLSNNGEYRLVGDEKAKPGSTGIIASPRNRLASSGRDDELPSPGGKLRFSTGLGGCTTIQWGTSPFQIHFEFQQRPNPVAAGGGVKQQDDQEEHVASLSQLDATMLSLAASSKFPPLHHMAVESATKCRPMLTIESLLIPPSHSVVRRLNVPATLLAAQHKRAVAAGDSSAADILASLMPSHYEQKFEVVEDTLKLRRSDVRLILYAMWRERYLQYVECSQAARMARKCAATKVAEALSPQPESLPSFMTFVYRYFASRFPLGATTATSGGRKQSVFAAASATSAVPSGPYTNPIDMASVAVRTAVGEDRVAYCYLRCKTPDSGQPGIADAPLGGKYLAKGGVAPPASPTVDSMVALSPAAKEVLLALIHYSYEYKEVDADFRLFYLVSHQLMPEAAAINFFAMMESIYRDCDDAVLRHASENLVSGLAASSKVKRQRGPSLGSFASSTPTADGLAAAPQPPRHPATSESTEKSGPFRELYKELPTTKVEMRHIDATSQMFNFDADSSSEDDDTSITLDVRNPMLASIGSIGDSSLPPPPPLADVATSASSARTPKHALAGIQTKRFVPRGASGVFSSSTPMKQQVSSSKTQSAVLHRNGLVSLHEFLAIIEKNCFATYQLVKEVSGSFHDNAAALHDDENGGLMEDFATQDPTPHDAASLKGAGSASSSDEEDFADLIRTYREEARSRLEEEASDASPLCRVGLVPLTPIQAQRLKFALSLDQPSSVVKYASLFRPDASCARPSHFYDELLNMVIDHHLAIQDIIMDELITPSCSCRGAQTTTEGESPTNPACDGEVSVRRLLTHTIRWVGSVQSTPPPPNAPPAPKVAPHDDASIPKLSHAGEEEETTPSESAAPSPLAPLCIDIAARRFVLQLCESCPPDNTAGQFCDSVITLSSLQRAARHEATHPQLSALLENFQTLPLHHLAARLRTTLIVFEGELDIAHTVGDDGGETPPSLATKQSAAALRTRSFARSTSTRSKRLVGNGSSITSSLAFTPPSREILLAFRQEMDAACWECERRITLQRALHNDLLCVLPQSSHSDRHASMATAGGKQRAASIFAAGEGPVAGNAGKRGSSKGAVQKTAISFGDAVDMTLSSNGGGSAQATPRSSTSQGMTMSYRSFYEDEASAVEQSMEGRAGARSKFAAAAAAHASQKGRAKSISDAIRLAFDAARFASSDRTLTQLQEQKQIPLEICISSLLKRQLAPQFPVALLPPLGDLAVYHKALMVALLKPMDDAAANSTGSHGRRQSVLNADLLAPSAVPRRQSFLGANEHSEGATPQQRTLLAKVTSFALKRVSEEEMAAEQHTLASADAQDATTTGGVGFRRRLGSVAMGMYSSLT